MKKIPLHFKSLRQQAFCLKSRDFILGIALCVTLCLGCHQVPQDRPGWMNGMGGYSIHDDEMIRQWHQSVATGQNESKVNEVKFDAEKGDSNDGKLGFMKKMFRKRDSDRSEEVVSFNARSHSSELRNRTSVSNISSGLCYDDHLLPLERLSACETPLGKTIPIASDDKKNSSMISEATPTLFVERSGHPMENEFPALTDLKALEENENSKSIITADRIEPIDFAGAEVTKPVGLTQKTFDDSVEKTESVPIQNEGKIEWCDEEELGELTPEIPALEETEISEPIRVASMAALPGIEAESNLSENFETINPQTPDLTEADKTNIRATSAQTLETPEAESSSPSWQEATHEAIRLLQVEIDRRVASGEICASEEARLRLLLLSTGNITGAARKIAGTNSALQDFWERECHGLGKLIAAQEKNSEEQGWGEAVADLRDGVTALKTGLPMEIKKSLFVKEPSPFGYYEEVPAKFAPAQTVNVYYELDNVISKETKAGHEIAVFCRRELLDASDRPVIDTREKLCAGCSESPLGDIVLNLAIDLPKFLPSGIYSLRVTFLDKNGTLGVPVTRVLKMNVGDPEK